MGVLAMKVACLVETMTGAVLLWGLYHAWATGQEWVVLTIFPMMATPYLVAGAMIVHGVGLLGMDVADACKRRWR